MRFHDLQVYRKMDVTRERIGRILELREIILSFQTGFNLVNAAVVSAILEKYIRFGTLISYYASHTKTTLPTRKSLQRSSRWSDLTRTS